MIDYNSNLITLDSTKIVPYEKDKIKRFKTEELDFFLHDYEEQTKIKHNVLKAYLPVWATKLGAYNNLNYYDGFCGCGAYYSTINKELYYGSPIIAKESFIKVKKDNISSLYLNDYDNENIENLKSVFRFKKLNNNNIHCTNGDYEHEVNIFLDKLEKHPVPTFFFIDPYGINIKFDTIKRIMSLQKNEVFINFMYNFPRRFLKLENNRVNFNNFFGTTEWEDYRNFPDTIKERELIKLYKSQLKTCSKYVYHYRMSFSDKNETYYYLFHASNHRDGCSILKDSFASVNHGNVEFLGPNQPNPQQLMLINVDETKISELQSLIFQDYCGFSVKFNEILEKYIDSTPYLERHIKSAIINMNGEFLDIQHISSKTSVKPDDIIQFYKKPIVKIKSTQLQLF